MSGLDELTREELRATVQLQAERISQLEEEVSKLSGRKAKPGLKLKNAPQRGWESPYARPASSINPFASGYPASLENPAPNTKTLILRTSVQKRAVGSLRSKMGRGIRPRPLHCFFSRTPLFYLKAAADAFTSAAVFA